VSDQANPDLQYQVTLQSDDDKRINHYERLREDVRSEIKVRINQRDIFAIQLITTLGVICSVAFAQEGFNKVIIVAPMLSVYYTMQILYSYRLHDQLAKYLREILEPQLSKLSMTNPKHEWEYYYFHEKKANPGILRTFYFRAMWVVTFASMSYLWVSTDSSFRVAFFISSGIYLAAMISITVIFFKDMTGRGYKKYAGSSHKSGAYLS
jgi:hypothetical protein